MVMLPSSAATTSSGAAALGAVQSPRAVAPVPPSPPAAPTAEGTLTAEQAAVLRMAQDGGNVFFTGSAGTGKSYLLREIIRKLQEELGEEYVFVTATTGRAACNVGGTTLHYFAGIGLGRDPVDVLANRIRTRGNGEALDRWRSCKALVVDEVSMLDPEMLEKLHELAVRLRAPTPARPFGVDDDDHDDDHGTNEEDRDGTAGGEAGALRARPFDGIQVVMCGDFLQLPPIPRAGAPRTNAFECNVWGALFPPSRQYCLTHVFRQASSTFVTLLNELRRGVAGDRTAATLEAAGRGLAASGVRPTRLYARNVDVDRINLQELERCTGREEKFAGRRWWKQSTHKSVAETLERNCTAPAELRLRVGAQVMLVRNLAAERGLVNGSVGVVRGYGTYRGKKGVLACFRLPAANWPAPDAEPCNHLGLVTRANRAGPLEDGSVHVAAAPAVDGGVERASEVDVTLLVAPAAWESKVAGVEVARFTQVPLRLAYAMTVHKAQGMSISHLEVDLRGTFQAGQAYTALSRATDLEHLRVVNFRRTCVRADPAVLAFYAQLQTVVPPPPTPDETAAKRRRVDKPAAL